MAGVRAGIFEERNKHEDIIEANSKHHKRSEEMQEVDVLPASGDCVGEPGDWKSYLHTYPATVIRFFHFILRRLPRARQGDSCNMDRIDRAQDKTTPRPWLGVCLLVHFCMFPADKLINCSISYSVVQNTGNKKKGNGAKWQKKG